MSTNVQMIVRINILFCLGNPVNGISTLRVDIEVL